jgi:transposase
MADGDIVDELHAHLDEQQMLADQHLMDRGDVDAEVLAESQSR